jgi:hypothetical protein
MTNEQLRVNPGSTRFWLETAEKAVLLFSRKSFGGIDTEFCFIYSRPLIRINQYF